MARTIARYEREMDAELARLALEGVGLRAAILRADFSILIPTPFRSPAFELVVPDEEAERAREVLNQETS